MSKATGSAKREVARRKDAVSEPSPLPRKSPLDTLPAKSRGRALAATGGAVLVHAAVVFGALILASAATATQPRIHTKISQLIDVELPKPAPPPSEPPPPEPEAEPAKAAPPPPARVRAPAAKKEAPPPVAAEAGKVVTAANDVVDFGDTIVSGSGASYAGGVTEAGGTAKHAVTDTRARAGGVEGGTGTTHAGDLSRAPQLAGGGTWSDCPFPKEADELRLDGALVTLRVSVSQDGSVSTVDVKEDPGDGFGREARRCAHRKRWAPGLDRAGKPIAATALIKVRFERE